MNTQRLHEIVHYIPENGKDSLGIFSAAVSTTTKMLLVFPVKLAAWRNEELKECSLTCAPGRNSLRAVRLSDIMSVKPWTSGSILGSITWGGMYCVCIEAMCYGILNMSFAYKGQNIGCILLSCKSTYYKQ